MTVFIQEIRGRNGFLHGAPATPDQIRNAEEQLQLNFSEEYSEYLLELGIATFEGHELTGITKFPRLNVVDVTKKEKARNPNVTDPYYVIEETNIDGIIIWQVSSGEVYQTEFDGKPRMICKSLHEYIETV